MYARTLFRVVRAALVWVFSVAEVEHLVESGDERLGERFDVTEPTCDRRLVRGSRRERLRGEIAPGRK